MTYKFPQPIVDALLADGCPEAEINNLVDMAVLEFMLSHHGLPGWAPFLQSLYRDTIGREDTKPTDTYKVGDPIPEHLGTVTDMYKEVSQVRLAMSKDVDAVKSREGELKEHLIQSLEKDDGNGAVGKRYKAIISTERKPKIKEGGWPALHAAMQ